MDTDLLFNFLQKFAAIPPPVRITISKQLHEASFKKDEYLIKEGSINRDMFFLSRGLVNCFFTDSKGSKKTTLLLKEGDLIAFAESFYTKTPSFYNVQAIEPVEAIRVAYEGLETICKEHPSFERTARMMTMHYNFVLSHQIRDGKVNTVEERYRTLIKSSPELIQRVPVQDLASYLNTTRYHFSRIRQKIR